MAKECNVGADAGANDRAKAKAGSLRKQQSLNQLNSLKILMNLIGLMILIPEVLRRTSPIKFIKILMNVIPEAGKAKIPEPN